MERELRATADGSYTLHVPQLDEQYHSMHGAVQEARHVFIEMGLRPLYKNGVTPIAICEVGFGTGLNAFLSALFAKAQQISINYTAIEAYPVPLDQALAMHYPASCQAAEESELFEKLHTTSWHALNPVSEFFNLKKLQIECKDFKQQDNYDLVFYDAFGPRVQPELWKKDILELYYNSLKKNGVFVTYCAKGQVRRDLQNLGFQVERLPGPPGKREMLRAIK